MPMVRRLLAPIVEVRPEELRTALLMFGYSLAAMTSYNIVQPVTRSAFITDLGADNLPYALLAAGLLVGATMQLYAWLVARLPSRWALPLILVGFTGGLLFFWALFRGDSTWVSAGFYLFGQIFGALLLSQFWTLANEIYDPRQARRLFGFIGGGASLGGMAGSGLAALVVGPVGTDGLLLFSALTLVAAALVVVAIVRREPTARLAAGGADAPSVGLVDAWRLIRDSPSLRQITLLVSFAACGAIVLDQQLSMAAEQFRGGGQDDITRFLASVRFFLSTSALLIQVLLVKQIYRFLGVGVALLILPITLGLTSTLILVSGALWAPAVASVVDRSIRYTVDRTTREIFFLPLPSAVRRRAKSFVDVTVDRMARGSAAVLVLVLIKPWGVSLAWPQLSFVTLLLVAGWLVMAVRAKTRYVTSVRKGFEEHSLAPADVTIDVTDLTTVETLLEELGHPDEKHVLYAIDVLESLDKRHLVTPLLLHHESPAVRARAVTAIGGQRPEIARRWQGLIQRLVNDDDPEVRAKAIVTLATVRNEDAVKVARDLLDPSSPRMAASAAVVLAASGNPADIDAAETTLAALANDTREGSALVRRDIASAIRQIGDPRCRHLLIPLLMDQDPGVAEAAMRSVRSLRPLDDLFVPTLISLLGDRRLKSGAREALISYGEPVLDILGHTLRDPQEDAWVRRHIPATVARIPCQRAIDLLVEVLDDRDRFLRYKVVAAIETLHRRHEVLGFSRDPFEALLLREANVYFEYLILRHDLFDRGGMPERAVLSTVLTEKSHRAVDRAYRLLGLLHPWRDIVSARWAIERRTGGRAGAVEYLDNVFSASLRRAVIPMLEDLPLDTKIRRGHQVRRTHPRSVEDSLLALINDPDEVVAAAALELIRDQQQWALTDDVEHVLAHRDARDWLVFEAASWTLAATRLTAEQRRRRWLEPLPSIVLADRLRHLPIFGGVEIEEMCRLVASGQQTRHDDQTTLLQEGIVPDTFHLLIDGQLDIRSRRTSPACLQAPGLTGFEEALAEKPSANTVVAMGPAVTLAVTRDDLLTVLTGNTDLVQGLFRTIAESTTGNTTPPIVPGTASDQSSRTDGDLTLVQRVLLLQQISALAHVPSDELAQLAALAREVPLEEGAVLSSETDPPVLCVVIKGALALRDTADTETGRAGPGDAVGLFETLAGSTTGAHGRDPLRLVVVSSGAALRLERDDLFDLIAHRPVLLQHLFATLFSTSA